MKGEVIDVSRVRDKAQAILARGQEKRGTWTPKLGSAPLKRYMWWEEQTGYNKPIENFCHYFWVVVFFAPLLSFKQTRFGSWLGGRLSRIGARIEPGLYSDRTLQWVTIGASGLFVAALYAVGVAKLWPETGWWSLLWAAALLAASVSIVIAICVAIIYSAILLHHVYKRAKQAERPDSKPVVVRVVNAARTTGEYAVLVGQIARTKKWRICPIVVLPTKGEVDGA